jgi:hypothetical protein
MQASFTINKTIGYADVTEFIFNSVATPSQYEILQEVLWDFGDGTFNQNPSPSHVYSYPGNFLVSYNVYSKNINTGATTLTQVTSTINVNLYVNESIYFDFVPPPTFAGHYNRYPFKVNITSSKVGEHIIDLGCQFSRSYQNQNPQNKWSFLRPEWKFTDLEGNVIQSIKTQDSILRIDEDGRLDPNGKVAGVSGYAEFYFIDDIYNFDLAASQQPYTTIIATLQTSGIRGFSDSFNSDKSLPGFSNSLATATCPYIVLWRTPQYLKITENGIRNFSNPRWSETVNPVIANTVYLGNSYPDDWIDGNGVKVYNPSLNFSHNFPLTNNRTVSLSIGTTGISSNFVPQPPIIQWIDNTGYKVPGYYKGSFTTEKITTQSAVITAGCIMPCVNLSANFIMPILWLSNPEAGLMVTAQYQYQNSLSAVLTPNLNIAQIHNFEVPIISEPNFTDDPMSMSGFHGINSVAALPAPNFHAWASDREMNKLYRFSTQGKILCAIDINEVVETNRLQYLVPNQVSPASISLDGDRNIWMTLYDTVSVLKFDPSGNFLFATTPLSTTGYVLPTPSNLPRDQEALSRFDQESFFYTTTADNFEDVNLIEPTCIETDINNNAWVTYSNTFSGFLIKYNSDGELTYSYNYPIQTHPQELASDKDGNIWVCLSHISYNDAGFIEKRNTNGTLLSTFGPFRGPNHITLDVSQNLWFTHSYQWIGYINNTTGSVSSLQLSGSDITSYIPDWIYPVRNTDETAFEGIASDIRNKIYVVNSVENQIYVVNANTFSLENRFYVNPQGFNYFLDDQFEPTQMEYNIWTKSLQAQGDWSGWKWINKYGVSKLPDYSYNESTTVYLTGQSNFLNFYKENPYEIYKINENHDLAKQMKDVAFMPSLVESTFLFDNFLATIFGQYPFKHDDLGVESYEKISNFVNNQSDLDYCNIDQLYSLANSLDLDSDDFILNYPFEIKRLMDLASVNQTRLWGTRLQNQDNFNVPSKEGILNRGNLISTSTYYVSAGTPVVLKAKSIDSYRLIPTGELNSLSAYSLNDLASSIGLDPITWDQYYEFYSFEPGFDNTQIEGLIDWSNPQTTLSEYTSSEEFWSGNEGAMETMFSYYLYKGLGLLE